ncbi:MAG: tRNA (guanosine(37)-N1)-methyltransferase TrmD [Alphaproteobacteria bacterium]|nr:tRNA (guanosine(37)-N1)-methyltransferase TrmD [Alphaproteobacteria bacterium]
MKINFLTLYPEMFPGFLNYSLMGKALEKGLWSYQAINIRDFATDNYKTVDDTPFGGGAGQVMKADVVDKAIRSVYKKGALLYMSPKGKPLNQQTVIRLAKEDEITILSGRFEGIDERVIESWPFETISIGDFVLSGGEPAALMLTDAVLRYVPGVLGNADSVADESFAGDGLLEYPQYTRPAVWNGKSVPEVLLSGHHKNIEIWRKEQSKKITQQIRPDIWEKYQEKL